MSYRAIKALTDRAAQAATLLAVAAALTATTGCTLALEMGPQRPKTEATADQPAAQSEAAAEETPAPADDEELEIDGVALRIGSLTSELRLAE